MADIGKFFRTTLPAMAASVASGIPGPVGAVATIISAALGKAIKPDSAEIAAAVANATPEQIIELRKQDQQHAEQMQKLGFDHIEDLERLAVEDRKSARDLQVQTRGKTAPALAWMVVLSFTGVVVAVLGGWGRVEAAFAGTLVGYLGANAAQVVAYYFGSSAGSDRKTELMAGEPAATK